MIDIHSLTLSELKEELVKRGEKPFRALQLFNWVYKKGVTKAEHLTDLSKATRSFIDTDFAFSTIKLKKTIDSDDGETTKFLWELFDGKLVESVLIRSYDRRTVCVSSQVGCPARCAFCASGKLGLMRNLSVSEIIQQVFLIDTWLRDVGEEVTHVVYMGMGEPFENYDNVVKSIRFLIDPDKFHMGQRRITVSTVGVVEGIEKFTNEGLQVNLVLSLHAPNQMVRKKIIPYARKYDIHNILDAMVNFARKTKRDITYEYTLMAGINDSEELALELAELVRDHPCTVNLIPYNPVEGLNLKRPEKDAIFAFRDILLERGIETTWRYTKGKDIAAACGQLAQLNKIEGSPLKILAPDTSEALCTTT